MQQHSEIALGLDPPFLIVLLLFGIRRLRNIGGYLGGALKGFRRVMGEDVKSDAK